MKKVYNPCSARKNKTSNTKSDFSRIKGTKGSAGMKFSDGVKLFSGKKWSFVLMKDGKILYKSRAERLKPLILCIKKHQKEMTGAVVFDKIVGRAAAMLLEYAKVAEVWTPTISQDAKKYLKKNKIKIEYEKEVKNIMNQKGDDLCPMEKLSRKMGSNFVIRILEL